MQSAQDKAKHHHDIKAKIPNYKLGDKVLRKRGKVATGLPVKMADEFDGPFEIIELGSHFTYKLKNCEDNKVIGSFINASSLKAFHQRESENIDNPQQANMPIPENANTTPPPADTPLPQVEVPQPRANDPQIADIGEQPPNMDNNSTTKQPQTQPPEPAKDMSNICIIRASRKGEKQRYRIEWPDGSRSLEPERNVPQKAIDNYLKHYTKLGRKRKQKPKFFTKSTE